eukprot:scaffold9836_cov37-Prasinocladus_malaysianus.AAC.3
MGRGRRSGRRAGRRGGWMARRARGTGSGSAGPVRPTPAGKGTLNGQTLTKSDEKIVSHNTNIVSQSKHATII